MDVERSPVLGWTYEGEGLGPSGGRQFSKARTAVLHDGQTVNPSGPTLRAGYSDAKGPLASHMNVAAIFPPYIVCGRAVRDSDLMGLLQAKLDAGALPPCTRLYMLRPERCGAWNGFLSYRPSFDCSSTTSGSCACL
jgi:hypothetical protein